MTLVVAVRFSLSSALSFFGPSLGPPFGSCEPQTLRRPRLTSPRLSTRGPPRVSAWSFRSRLWALQTTVSDFGLRVGQHARPRPSASLPIGVPSVERLPPALSRRLLAETTWRFGYGRRHQPPSGTFHPDRPSSCRAHGRRLPSLRGDERNPARGEQGRAACFTRRAVGDTAGWAACATRQTTSGATRDRTMSNFILSLLLPLGDKRGAWAAQLDEDEGFRTLRGASRCCR